MSVTNKLLTRCAWGDTPVFRKAKCADFSYYRDPQCLAYDWPWYDEEIGTCPLATISSVFTSKAELQTAVDELDEAAVSQLNSTRNAESLGLSPKLTADRIHGGQLPGIAWRLD